MADGDKLYLDWELRGTLEEQIEEAIKDTEKLQAALKKASDQGLKVDASKFADNFRNNVSIAEKALYKLIDAKEKADKAIARNAEFKNENLYGFDDTKLQQGARKLDDIIDKLMHIGVEAVISRNHVKNLLEELSADVVSKSVTNAAKELVGDVEKEEKSIQKAIKDAAKAKAKADKDDEDAAARNMQNQQKVQDAMARIATARANLSKVSDKASEQERMHVQLLLNLLDRLSSKLAELRKQDLGGKGAIDGVLGSGYQGLMRNVVTAIADITSGRLNMTGMSDEEWNAEKLLATRNEIINTFEKEFERQEKVNRLVRERIEMEAHRKAQENAKDEAEMKVVAEQINKELAARAEQKKQVDAVAAAYKALEKIKLDTESQQRIATIKNQTAEYSALEMKLNGIIALMKDLDIVKGKIESGEATLKDNFKETVTANLDAIQRQYNESLARGKQALLDEADAEKKNADAKRKTAAAAKELNRVNADMVDSFNRVLDRVTHNSRMLGQLQNQFAGFVGVYGIERLLKNIIQIGGEFEVQHIALQSILGDVQQANSMFEQMKELAVVSPFNFRQLAGYSKQIAAFNIPYEEMYDTTKRLADMAAGLGVDMGRLILAYGQVRSAAVLRGQELRQFTEAGIPMVQALANEFTKLNGRAVSTAEVFELISKRAVPFEMVKKVMWDMTSEGGRFFDMQFVLSDTLAGKWSNLQDAWEIMLLDFARGASLSGQFLKSMVTLLTKLTETVNTLTPLLAGGGLFYMMKKTQSYIGGMGLLGIDANIKKAQQLQAIELRRKLINQEITAEQYKQAMVMNNSQAKYYVLLANEGKLKDYQIQKLILQNKINNERLHELVMSGELNMREAAQIRLWRMKNKEVSAFRMYMNGLMSGAGSFMKTNGWLIAIDVAITALTTWYAKAEEAKAKNEELTKGFANAAKELKESYNSLNDNNLKNDEDYKGSIAGLKEQLKQHSANYDAIIREANAIKSLEDQYKYLKNALQEEAEVAFKAEEMSERFGETTRSAFEKANEYARYMTTGRQGFWDVVFGADTDVDRGLEKSVKNIYEKIIKIIPNVGKDEKSNELYRKLRNSIEEQLGFGSKERMLINIKLNEMFQIDNVEDATTLVVDKFGEMLSKAAPEIANKIRYGQELNEAEKDKVAQLVNEATEETKKKYPYYASTLQQLLNDSDFTANIKIRFSTSGKPVNEFQKWIYGNMDQNLREDIKNIATAWGESGNSYDAQNAAKRDIDAAKNELEARKKQTALAQKNLDEARKQKKSAEEIERLEKQREAAGKRESDAKTLYENRRTAALQGLGYDYEGELKKSNRQKASSSSKKDKQLDAWRTELKEIQELFRQYEALSKRMSDSDAAKEIWRRGLVPSLFDEDGNLTIDIQAGINKAIDDLLKKTDASTEERERLQIEIKKLQFDVDNKEMDRVAESFLKKLEDAIGRESKQWDLYKKVLDATGNKEQASQFAFGRATRFENYAQQLRSEITEAIQKSGIDESKTIDELLGMNDEALRKVGIFEKATDGIYQKLKKLKDVEDSLNATNVDLWLKAITNAKELDTQIALINQKYDDMRKALEKNRTAQNSAQTDKALLGLDKANREEVAKATWDNFKATEEWGRIFSNLDDITTDTLRYMLDKLRAVAPSIRDSVEATKALYEAMDKIQDQLYERNPFAALGDYLSKMSAFREVSAEIKGSKPTDKIYINPEDAKKTGLSKNGKGWTGTVREYYDAMHKTEKGFSKIVGGIGKTFNALQDVLQPVIKLFDTLGNEDLSNFFSIGTDALGSAASFASGLSQLQGLFPKGKNGEQNPIAQALGAAGPYGAAAAAGLSIVTSIFAMHDAALQEEIEASQTRQKEMENLTKNLEKVLERTLGGIYNTSATEAMVASFEREIRDMTPQMIAKTFGGTTNQIKYKGYITEDTLQAVKTAQQTKKYYDAAYASLLAQRDEVRHQMDMESEKKNTDMDKMADFRQQLVELDDEVDNFARDLADTLYDIDVKSWAQELGDALFEAWQQGEDGAEAFRRKASEIMADLAKNIAVTKLIETAMDDVLNAVVSEMKRTKGLLDEQSLSVISQEMAEVSATLPQSFNMLMDGLNEGMKKAGLMDMKDLADSSGSGSMSSSIKGVTENTADLLASYINSIRADVSYNRFSLSQILTYVQAQADMPVIARAQLTQLQQIADNTGRNADLVSRIYDILHGVSPDGTSIKIK